MTLGRPSQSLPFELAFHCKALLEARDYTRAFALLDSLLVVGNSSGPDAPLRAYVAPPSYLALALSIVVSPATSTRAKSQQDKQGADAALRYMRNVHHTVARPLEALRIALTFQEERGRRRHNNSYSPGGSPTAMSFEAEVEGLRTAAAESQSLWYRASDFWHVIGWAFNCSSAHQKRWERWKVWLELVIDLVEQDWESRLDLDGDDADSKARFSLLWHLVSSLDPTTRVNRRRMRDAILACATPTSKAQFPEVWRNELLAPVKTDEQKLFERDEEGNWNLAASDEEDDSLNLVRLSHRQHTRSKTGVPSPVVDETTTVKTVDAAFARYGGSEGIALRQRLFYLLAELSIALPEEFTSLDDLFDTFAEEYIRLPLLSFQALLSTSTLQATVRIAFHSNLLLPLVSGTLPNFLVVDMTQDHLEQSFLAKVATTQSYVANAKVSTILEHMFKDLVSVGALVARDELRHSLELGIRQRGSVHGKRQRDGEEDLAKKLMEDSAQRLLGMLELLEIQAGMEPQMCSERNISFMSTGSELTELETTDDEATSEADIMP